MYVQVPAVLCSEFEEIWRSNRHRPLAVRNHLIACICPQIYGLFAVKLAILLTLIGGITETVSACCCLRCHDTIECYMWLKDHYNMHPHAHPMCNFCMNKASMSYYCTLVPLQSRQHHFYSNYNNSSIELQ
jgi:hypothetical protein